MLVIGLKAENCVCKYVQMCACVYAALENGRYHTAAEQFSRYATLPVLNLMGIHIHRCYQTSEVKLPMRKDGTAYIVTISGHKEESYRNKFSHFPFWTFKAKCPLSPWHMLCMEVFKEENDPKSGREKGEGQGNKEHLQCQNGVLIDRRRSDHFLNRGQLKVKAIKDC